MFANAAARRGIDAAQAKLERVGRVDWRRELIEGAESVPLPAVRNRDEGNRPASKSAVAARSAFLRYIVGTAKLAYASIKTKDEDSTVELSDLIEEAFALGIAMIEPFTRRGRESQRNAMIKMMSRGSISSGSIMRGSGGLTLSMSNLLKECKREYIKLTGNSPSLTTMPNFIRYLSDWASASVFLGEWGTSDDTMPFYDKNTAVTTGCEVLLVFKNTNGATTLIKGDFVEEKIGDGRTAVTVKRLVVKLKWLNGEVSVMENSISFSVTMETKDTWKLISEMGHSGTGTLIGVRTDTQLPYQDKWMDANALPPSMPEVAHLMAEFWTRETAKRRQTLASVDATVALRLQINFTEHTLQWFFANRIEKIRSMNQAKNPFLNVPMSEWKVVCANLRKGGQAVALALLSIEATMDDDTPKLDVAGIHVVWNKVFANGGFQEWVRYKTLMREHVRAAKDKKEKPGPFDMTKLSEDETKEVVRILEIVDDLRRMSVAANLPTVRFSLQGIQQAPSVAYYIATLNEGDDYSTETYLTWCRENNVANDVVGDKVHETGVEMIKRMEEGDYEEETQSKEWDQYTKDEEEIA